MYKPPQIPDAPHGPDRARARFDNAVKEMLELVAGRRSGRIAPLESTATTAEVIEKNNELLARLQGE